MTKKIDMRGRTAVYFNLRAKQGIPWLENKNWNCGPACEMQSPGCSCSQSTCCVRLARKKREERERMAGLHDVQLDLPVWTGVLNTGRVYTGSGKIWVGCISDSGKIRVGRISILRVQRTFFWLFLFFVKIKNSAYLLLKVIRVQ